ncbi:terB_like domain containing protein [Oxalobacteraceae bacterium]
MGSGDLFKHLFKALNLDKYVGQSDNVRVELTPYLALLAAIIYMMIADGEISDSESSQLQSVVGDNDEALHRAILYVQSTPIDVFLTELPSIVFGNDKLCILLNACDSIMSDGVLSNLEWDLFQNLLAALGHSEKSFKPYFGAISIKNKRSILGSFEEKFSPDVLTPQLSLTACLLYMMSSDGVMAKEEIGQLQVIVGNSKSLLQSGLKYVGKIKAHQFFKDAPALLSAQQKLCILINACDTMLSDGKIENTERELFKRMLAAFGHSEDSFKSYYQVLSLKNERPLDRRQAFKKAGQEIPSEIAKKDKSSEIFDRKFLVETEKSSNEDFKKTDTTTQGNTARAKLDKSTLESSLSSKMRENTDTLSKAMESEQGLSNIERNANQADDSPFSDAKKSASGPTINRKFNEDSTNASADKASQAKASGPEISRKSPDGDADAKIKQEINDSSDGPKISNNIVDGNSGPKISNNINDSDSGPKLSNNIIDGDSGPKLSNNIVDNGSGPTTGKQILDADNGPKLKNRINDGDDGPEINRQLKDSNVDLSSKHLHDGSGPIDFRTSKDAEFTNTKNGSSDSGPEIARRLSDTDQSISGDPNLSPNDGPIIRNEMVDDSGAVAGSPKKRMVFAKIQTEKIHGCLDQLEKYDFNKPSPKGVDLSSIAITPKPTVPKTTKPKTVITAEETLPVITEHSPATKSTELTTLPEPVMTKMIEPVVAKTEAIPESVPLTSSRTRLMAGVMFTALSATHGISSMGESQAQIEMVNHGYQAVQVQTAFQSVSAQQVGYQLSANALDLSLGDTSKLTDEQKDITESRLVLYRSTIQNQETSPTTLNGKKELADTLKQQDELTRQASGRMTMFALSKSILLFGIGLSFMAFFSRSRWVLYGSAATAVIGMGITANGFFALI